MREIQTRKEQMIDQLLEDESYKSLDGRQLYQLSMNELEFEIKKRRNSSMVSFDERNESSRL
jgi:hypothetical protein